MPRIFKETEKQGPINEMSPSYMDVGTGSVMLSNDMGGSLYNPIMKHANVLPPVTAIAKPDEDMVIRAHEDVGLKLSAGSMRHPKRVKRATEKYEAQKKLLRARNKNITADPAKKAAKVAALESIDATKLILDDSKNGGDEALINNYGRIKKALVYIDDLAIEVENHKSADAEQQNRRVAHLKTMIDIRTYYEILEALILNRYYALLPREEMRSLSEEVLIGRLNKLYDKPENERNKELIDFYQNLLRLKILGISDKESVREREKEYLSQAIPPAVRDERQEADEIKKMSKAYSKLQASYKKRGKLYSAGDIGRRNAQFFMVYGKDIDRYRNHMTSEEASKLLADYDRYVQNGGAAFEDTVAEKTVDRVLAGQKDAKKLEKAKGEAKGIILSDDQREGVRLIATFLLRRSSEDKNASESFVYNLLQASAEQQLFTFYLVEKGRQKKGIGSDFYHALTGYVPDLATFRKRVKKHFWGGTDWNVISDAARFSRDLGRDVKKYGHITSKAKEAEEALLDAKKEPSRYMEQGRHTMEAMAWHIAELRQFYRLSGLAEDMPPDLVGDRKLRERLYRQYNRVGELASELARIIKAHPEVTANLADKSVGGVRTVIREEEKESAVESAFDVGNDAGEVLKNVVMTERGGNAVASVIDETARDFLKGNGRYNISKNGVVGLSSLLSFIDSIYGLYSLSGEKNLSLTDEVTKWVSGTNDVLDSLGDGGESVLNLLSLTGVVDENADSVAIAGNVFDGVTLAAGLITSAASIVQLGRAVANGKDLKKARTKFEQRTGGRELTKDEKRFERYLKHTKNQTGRDTRTASVNLVTGIASVTTTVMAITGVMAPVAAGLKVAIGVTGLFYNLYYTKRERRSDMLKTVDDYLGVGRMVEELKAHPTADIAGSMSDSELAEYARKEALGQLGYTSAKQCFRDISRQFAELLYRKVFKKASADRDEWDMYNNALSALGMKKVEYKSDYGDHPEPTVDAIMARIMG